jgi:hypothetical protein
VSAVEGDLLDPAEAAVDQEERRRLQHEVRGCDSAKPRAPVSRSLANGLDCDHVNGVVLDTEDHRERRPIERHALA